jgi:hypothetical protein
MWYAAGNTTGYAMAARNGLGVLGFSVGSIVALAPVMAERDLPRRSRGTHHVRDDRVH